MKKLNAIATWILVIVSSFWGMTLQAQQDAKSKTILQNVSRLYKSYSTITADFTLTTKAAKRKPVSSTGKLWTKGQSFKLAYADQEIFCNGITIWAYSPDDAEVTIEDVKKRTNNMEPSELFTFYSKGFKANYEGPVASDDGKAMHDVLKLVPKKKEKYSYIKAEIEQGSYKIKKVTQYYKNGTEVIIAVTKVIPNSKLDDSFFAWNASAHPGVASVDLRKTNPVAKPKPGVKNK